MRDTCAFWLVSCTSMNVSHPPSKSDWSKRSAIEDRVHHSTTGRNWTPLDRQVRWTFTKVLSASPIFRYCKITAGAFQNHVFIVQRGARSKAFSLRVLGQPRTLQDLHQGENKKTRLSTPGTAAPITTEIWKKDKNPPNLQSTAPAQGLKWYMTASIAKLTSYPLYFPHHHWSSGRSRRIHPWQLLQETRQMMITVQIEIGAKIPVNNYVEIPPPDKIWRLLLLLAKLKTQIQFFIVALFFGLSKPAGGPYFSTNAREREG